MSRLAALLLVGAGALSLGACGYDFDAAFTQTSGGGGAGATGGSGGSGGSGTGGDGGTATGAGGDGGMGGTPGGLPPGNEDCFNGVDDDRDMLVDCEDPDCTNGACHALPPTEWGDPIAVVLDDADNTLPDCGTAWPQSEDADASLSAPPATCDACVCGTPDVTCNIPAVTIFDNPGCGDIDVVVQPNPNGNCTPFNPSDLDSFDAPVPQLQSASCAPGGGNASVPSASWDEHARLCSGATFGVGCGGDLCVPESPTFTVCVVRDGDQMCPAGYPTKTLVHDGFSDSRDCTACSCGTPNNPQCSGAVELWVGDTNCVGNSDFIQTSNGGCETVQRGTINSSLTFTPNNSAGPCPTMGGNPTGMATPTGTRTICCAN